jgi:hypothetical protein
MAIGGDRYRASSLLVGLSLEDTQAQAESGKAGIRKIGKENRPTMGEVATSKPNHQPNLRNSQARPQPFHSRMLRPF